MWTILPVKRMRQSMRWDRLGDSCTVCTLAVLLISVQLLRAQEFTNLDFEASYVVSSYPSSYGFDTGRARVPGWTAYHAWEAANYLGGTELWYNNETLDAANASLLGVNYLWQPAIVGSFSILLKGGTASSAQYGTSGVGLGQVGQIPAMAKSITFIGLNQNFLQVSFGGQRLSFFTLASSGNRTRYGADVSGYAGQVGELLFHLPISSGPESIEGFLDHIRFSPEAIPEPNTLGLAVICASCLWARLKSQR